MVLARKRLVKFLLSTLSVVTICGAAFEVSSQKAFAETVEISVDGSEKQDPIAAALQKRLALKFRKISKKQKVRRGALVQFYSDRDYQSVWVDKDGLNAKAETLLRVLGRADRYGLVSKDFKTSFTTKHKEENDSAISMAHIELELSLAALKYVDVARNGRFEPTKLSRFMEGTKEKIDNVAVLEKASKVTMLMSYLESFHPSHPQFKALKKELAVLGENQDAPKIVKIPTRGPVLKEGMVHPHAALIRKRLNVKRTQLDGDDPFDPELYDTEVVAAIAKFQESKGLKADGIVGGKTRLVLNEGIVDNKWRKQQVLANMERWRWLPDQLGKDHIFVNIPEYVVRVKSDGKVVHKERIIVGKIANKTPFFSDKMETVVFNPYWHVPQSIIANEMNYSVPNGYEGEYRNGMLHVRQPPGPRNALGRVKFLFPNKHAVYLHDTPTKHLFNSRVRAFSHGCMRVRDPKRMAEVILNIGYKGSAQETVRRHWGNLRNAKLALNNKIPVHVTYFTARADDNGKIQYFKDIYTHDKRIATVLNGGRVYLEPKQRIKKRKPEPDYNDYYDPWGFNNVSSNRYRAKKRRNKKRYGNSFWGDAPKRKKPNYRRRKNTSFDPFGLGW